jgi:hypothetical protein
MVVVARFAAWIAGVARATITSTSSFTSEAARSGSWSYRSRA